MALIKCPDCGSDVSTQAPTCPKCGRPIALPTIGTPPTIGADRIPPAPVARRRTSLKDLIGGIVAGVGVLWLMAYCVSSPGDNSTATASSSDQSSPGPAYTLDESSPTATPAPPRPRPIQTYTAEQLYAMFHANEVKANQKIGKAIVRFTGTIASIEQSDFSKTPELQILGACNIPDDCQDPEAWTTFEADLKTSELSTAVRLVKGQTITLQCNEVSMPVDVYAQGCVVLPKGTKSTD